MKTKISIFITAIGLLLIGATIAIAQGTKVYFKKEGATVFESSILDIDSIVFYNPEVLSEEEVKEFYTNFEYFTSSSVYQSYNTIEELQSATKSWLSQQPEVKNIKTEGNVLTVTFKDGEETEIEFLESVEPEGFVFEYESEFVDASYFTCCIPQNATKNKQLNAKSQYAMQVEIADNTNSPNYVFPVLWEPYALEDGISLLPIIDKYYNNPERLPLPTVERRLRQNTECDPLSMGLALTSPASISIGKPNLIFINTHGNSNSLGIGCCSSIAKYNIIKEELRKKGITISDKPVTGLPIMKGTTSTIYHYIYLTSTDLKKLLQDVDFSNSIVFLDACKSSSIDSSFSDVFLDLGARGVFGYSDKICVACTPKITGGLLNNLLIPKSIPENPSKKTIVDINTAYNRVFNNPNFAQSKFLRLRYKDGGTFKFRYPPLGTRPIVDAPQLKSIATQATTMENEEVVGCYIDYYSPSEGYSESYCGLVYSSETNDPKIDDGKSKIVYINFDHDIFDGEDYYFSFDDIEYNKQYYYKAFVGSNYNGSVRIYYSDEVEPFKKEDECIVINGVCWATRNVGEPGALVQNTEDYGGYYQWNRGTTDFLPYNDYYNSVYTNSSSWLPVNDPSPIGYRVPTLEEMESLWNPTYVAREWITQNNVNGIKFTDKTSGESIFLPAAGVRDYSDDGMLYNAGSRFFYWGSTGGTYGATILPPNYSDNNKTSFILYYSGSGPISQDILIATKQAFRLNVRSCASDGIAQVRFQKTKAYTNIIAMALDDEYEEELAFHNFGTPAGTSQYTEIPSGNHTPWYYYYDNEEGWECLPYNNTCYTHYFKAGHKYTIICDDNGTKYTFNVKDDGRF